MNHIRLPSHRVASKPQGRRALLTMSTLALMISAITAQAADPDSFSIGIIGDAMNGGSRCISSSDPTVGVTNDGALCDPGTTGGGVGFMAYTTGGTPGAYVLSSSPTTLRFGVNGTEALRIDTTGIIAKKLLNMSNNKITALANGTVVAGGQDGINGGQLYSAANSTALALGTTQTAGVIVLPSFALTSANTINGTTGAATNVTTAFQKVDDALNKLSQASGLVKQAAAGAKLTVGAATDGTEVDFAGTAGARKLTNVADGTVAAASKDAVNGGQLHGTANSIATNLGGGSVVNADGTVSAPSYDIDGTSYDNVGDALTNLDDRTTINEGDIANLLDGTAGMVQQSAAGAKLTVGKDTDGTEVDFAGTAGARKLTNIADGTIAAASKDAVNGGQLHGTANSIATNLGGGSVVNADGTVSAPSYDIDGTSYDNVGDALTNLDDRTTINEGDILNILNGTAGMVQQSAAGAKLTVGKDTDGTEVDFAGTAGARKLTNIADGTIAAASKDAVNGGQLYGTANSIAGKLGGGAVVNADGTVSAPSYALSNANVINGTTGAAADAGTALDKVDAALGVLDQDIDDIAEGKVGLVQQAAAGAKLTVGKDTDGTEVDFAGTAGARKLTNVSNGLISATSLDAINGSQLHATATSIATNFGGGSTVDADGKVTAPSYAIDGTTFNNVGDALTNLDDRVDINETSINNIINGTAGLVQQSAAGANLTVGVATDGAAVDFSGTAGARKLMGVSNGAVSATSTEAVNGSQLFGTANSTASALGGGSTVNADGTISAPSYSVGGTTHNNVGSALTNLDGRTTQNTTDIANLTTNINNGTVGLVKQDATTKEVTVAKDTGGNVVNVNGTDGNRQVTGVAAGAVTTTSVDAVNGAQLHGVASSTSNALGGGSVVNADGTVSAPTYNVGGSTVNNVGDAITNLDGRITNGEIGLVKQNAASQEVTVAAAQGGNTVNFAGASGARRLTGVERGIASSDGVNVAQLNEAMASANRYTDESINNAWRDFGKQLDDVNRHANRGIAAASALINVTPYVPGRVALNAGMAYYGGETALGVGISRWSDDGKFNLNGGVSTATGGDSAVVRIGVGIVF